jgi:hypothetical protein
MRDRDPRPEGRVRKAVRRVSATLATVALLLGIGVGFVRVQAEPREYEAPPGVVKVDCGSLFSSTRWSLDEGCEREIVGLIIAMTLLVFVAIVFGLIALPLLILRFRLWLYGMRT